MRLNRNGQGMLEYIVIIVVVVAAILIFANNGLKNAIAQIFDRTGNQMNNAAANINFN